MHVCQQISHKALQLSLVKKIGQFQPQPFRGKSYEQVLADRSAALFPLYAHYYKKPFYAVEGHMEFLYDEKGKEYIDLIGGVSTINVGHSHPRLIKIYQEQAPKLLNLSSHYVNQYQVEYVEALTESLGHGLDTAFFFNSGSQANDFANSLARAYTRNNTVVTLRNGYHGTAGTAYGMTSLGTWNGPLSKSNALERLAWPHFYRSAHQDIASLLKDAEQQLDASTNGKVAGIWLEPVMGAGGIIPLKPVYAQNLYKIIKKYGGLFISDEVQTGFCRIGVEKWGFNYLGIKPDIIIVAKAIANGQPLSAVVTRRQIADTLKHDYFPAFNGGPLETRLALEVLRILEENKLNEHAQIIGTYLYTEFNRLKNKCKYIGDVRGKGMMLGVEFVKDQKSKEPNPDLMSYVHQGARERGVLFGKGGHKGHMFRVMGPLCLTMKSAQTAIGVLEEIIDSIPK